MVRASFSLPVGETVLNASVQVPAGRTTLTELLPILQNIESTILRQIDDEARETGRQISCRAGCGACCRQLVPLSLFEAEALANWMQSLPADQRARLQTRFQLALAALEREGIIDRLVKRDWATGVDEMKRLSIAYFRAGVACPFLENESCSIHPIRPMACREYLVTSPPELCQDPEQNTLKAVQFPLKVSQALFAIGRELTADAQGWIPLVFLAGWARSGIRPGDYVTGSGGEVLGRFLDELAKVPQIQEGA